MSRWGSSTYPFAGTLTYNDAGQMISAGSESFSYAGNPQAELLSDGSAAAITYGQDGQPWIQDYTATGSSENPANGNLYAYADDSPTNYIDPTGQSCFGDILGAIGGIFVLAGTIATVPETSGGSLLVIGVGFGSLALDFNAASSCLGFP